MNDWLEVHWGYSIWEKAASELRPSLGRDFLDSIDQIIHFSGLEGLQLSSSFSLDGDVLSQWRAYADDGNGFAIGFRAADMIKLPVRQLKVLYNEKKQLKEAIATIRFLHHVKKSPIIENELEFGDMCRFFSTDLSAFKNPAFLEEKEVRLLHLLNFESSNGALKLVDIKMEKK